MAVLPAEVISCHMGWRDDCVQWTGKKWEVVMAYFRVLYASICLEGL